MSSYGRPIRKSVSRQDRTHTAAEHRRSTPTPRFSGSARSCRRQRQSFTVLALVIGERQPRTDCGTAAGPRVTLLTRIFGRMGAASPTTGPSNSSPTACCIWCQDVNRGIAAGNERSALEHRDSEPRAPWSRRRRTTMWASIGSDGLYRTSRGSRQRAVRRLRRHPCGMGISRAAGLTPARLGAEEPVRQRGAGAFWNR